MTLLRLARVLDTDSLTTLGATLAGGSFSARAARANTELELDSGAAYSEASRVITAALRAHPQFDAAAYPAALLTPTFLRFEVGATPEATSFPGLVGEASVIRPDIAALIPLTDVSRYEGGALIIDPEGVPTTWRGQAGDCLLYAPGVVHRFEPLLGGSLTVAVLLIQSRVSAPTHRQILFDLAKILENLTHVGDANPHLEAIRRSYFKLLRRWT